MIKNYDKITKGDIVYAVVFILIVAVGAGLSLYSACLGWEMQGELLPAVL